MNLTEHITIGERCRRAAHRLTRGFVLVIAALLLLAQAAQASANASDHCSVVEIKFCGDIEARAIQSGTHDHNKQDNCNSCPVCALGDRLGSGLLPVLSGAQQAAELKTILFLVHPSGNFAHLRHYRLNNRGPPPTNTGNNVPSTILSRPPSSSRHYTARPSSPLSPRAATFASYSTIALISTKSRRSQW